MNSAYSGILQATRKFAELNIMLGVMQSASSGALRIIGTMFIPQHPDSPPFGYPGVPLPMTKFLSIPPAKRRDGKEFIYPKPGIGNFILISTHNSSDTLRNIAVLKIR